MFSKVTLIGNVVRDVELKSLPSGTSVVETALAINRKYTSNGEKKEDTAFVDVVFWGRQAEIFAEYAFKGKLVHVEGRLTQDNWEQDGNKRSKLKVTAEDFNLLGGKEFEDKPKYEQKEKSKSKASVSVDEEAPF